MKVTHIITALDTGGAELMLLRLLQRLQPDSGPAQVISLSSIGPTGHLMREAGINVQALGMRPGRPDPRALVRLSRILQWRKPDVVQTWLYHADLVGGLAARLAGSIPVVWGLHLANLAPELNKRTTLLTARTCARLSGRLPAAIICCANATQTAHIAFGYRPERMLVIPNGFDLQQFRPSHEAREVVRRELGLSSDACLIGLVARMDPQKDHRAFIRAAGLLVQKHPDVHFILCGGGVTRENAELVAWIEEANIRDRCHLLGRRDDMPCLQASFDIACSSSLGEAFPLAVGEAMASGVPCVVTDVGDSALLVGPTGRVVPPGNPAALAAALSDLIDLGTAGRAASGEAARQRIVEHFSLDHAVQRYRELYVHLASATSSSHAHRTIV